VPAPSCAAGRPSRRGLALGFGLLSGGLLFLNTATRPRATLPELAGPRRYWEELAIAASQFMHHDSPPGLPELSIASGEGTELRHTLRRYLEREAQARQLRPWEFWRTLALKPAHRRPERLIPRDYDDKGRPALVTFAFRALGGVAPYFPVWLGALATLPVLIWAALELVAAGRPIAAGLFTLGVACSAHVVDLLALPYSAAGFYHVGLVALVPLATYALLGHGRSRSGLALRLLLAGTLFALCVVTRGSAMALLPGYLLAVLLATRRVLAAPSLRQWVLPALAAASLFLAPYVLLRQPGHHAVWGDLWQGLGDFDSSKGHTWSDPALRTLLRKHGMRLHRNVGVEFESDESERIARGVVLEHAREGPLWLASILAKRTLATLTQWKLWPQGQERTYRATTRANEGTIDRYYGLAATADVLGMGPWRWELPMPLWLAPSAALLLTGLAALAGPRLRAWRPRLGPPLGALACVAFGALALPVAFTTGSLEMQGFVVVYLFGLALVAENRPPATDAS